jgi:hypothetical protein
MFERFRNRTDRRDDYVDDGGGVATATRRDTDGDGVVEERPAAAAPVTRDPAPATRETAPATRETVRDVRARQRAEYGGLNWGSAFFGWLVAVGMAAILIGLLSAAGAAFGLSDVSQSQTNANADTIGIVGGILLVATLMIAYYCGGYVSGRMSRFDGARQGFGTWVIGLFVTIVLAVAGALFGAKYNVLEGLNLPRIPVDEGSLTAGAAIALAAVVVLTLLAAMGGGKAGELYHRKIDRVGYID